MSKERWIILGKIIALTVVLGFGGLIFRHYFRLGVNMYSDKYHSCDSHRFFIVKIRDYAKPHLGEYVTFNGPIIKPFFKKHETWSKVIAAVAGDHIRVQGNDLYINGKLVGHRPLLARLKQLHMNKFTGNASYTLKPGQMFMLGKNPKYSFDSRYWGPIGVDQVTGQILYRFM